MYLQSESVAHGSTLDGYDLCIAGAGAAGLAMAKRMAGGAKRVLVLAAGLPDEQGLPPGYRQKIYGGSVGEFLAQVDPLFLRRSRLHMYGGTTNHFGFWARPLDEVDFLPRLGYRASSWPITRAELLPFYREAMQFGRFGPFNFDDVEFWKTALGGGGFPDRDGDMLTGAIFHAQYEESIHDFQLQLGEALRTAENVSVLFNATVQRIESDRQRGHVTSLSCASIENGRSGHNFTVIADSYVLAMGGIETVRVLKLSDDLGNNTKDQLGRGFMVHPLITTAAEVRFEQRVSGDVRNFFADHQIRLKRSPPDSGVWVHDTAPLVDPRLLRRYPAFNAWGVLVPTPAILTSEKIGQFRVILRFDPEGDRAELNINWEQLPNEESRITLDGDEVDPVFGQPVIHLDWRLLEADKRTVVRALEICETYLRNNGAIDFRLTSDLGGGAERWQTGRVVGALETGDHHMGAIRMSATSQDGVVDRNSRLHSVDNLYVAGCSQFPTSGYANPTLTILALALRLADHLSRT